MKELVILLLVFSVVACVLAQNTPPPGSTFPPGGLVWQNCTKPNEYYDCGSACQTECKTLGQPCTIYTFRCVDACYCIKGYARDDKGNCIPIKQCKRKHECKDN